MAAGLTRDKDNSKKVIVDKETAIVLHGVARVYQRDPKDTSILMTAGDAGREWGHVIMSGVMKNYLEKILPQATIISLAADTFNTDAEIQKACGYLHYHPQVDLVKTAVRGWHGRRTMWLWRKRLKHFRLNHRVRVEMLPMPSEAGLKERLREIPAFLWNWWCLFRERCWMKRYSETWRFCDGCLSYTPHQDNFHTLERPQYRCSFCGSLQINRKDAALVPRH